MSLLIVQDLCFAYSQAAHLFAGVSFSMNPGDRTALVGRNGSGKSTLLRILAGELAPSSGSLVPRRDLKIATLAASPGGATLYDALLGQRPDLCRACHELRELEAQLDHDTAAANRYAERIAAYEQAGGYAFEARIHRVLDGLRFEPGAHAQPVESLSSGERMRASLARCLLSGAGILLLDEPTAHLDVRAREWLEQELVSNAAACLIVSHDRVFLNNVTTRTLALERGRMLEFGGNYDFYLEERTVRDRQEWDRFEGAQRRKAAAEDAAARRARLAAKVAEPPPGVRHSKDHYARKAAKVARTGRILRERALEEEAVPKPWEEQPIPKLLFPNVPSAPEVLLHASALSKSFGSRRIFHNLSFHVRRGERWALAGPNGSGKTTLLRILNGLLPADAGAVHTGARVRIGYYAQEGENLDLALSALDHCRLVTADETFARTLLACLRMPAGRIIRPLATLSAGECAKTALVRLMLSGVNLLLLDEPANHLERQAIEALVPTLVQFPGAIVFVSHDRYLSAQLATDTLHLPAQAELVETPAYCEAH
jgi:ATP-binding cassette subfamily F protein 3